MFSHPLTIAGAIVTIAGGLFLLFGVGSGEAALGREVINFHRLALAENVILIGCTLFVSGMLVSIADRVGARIGRHTVALAAKVDAINEYLSEHPDMGRNLTEHRELEELMKRSHPTPEQETRIRQIRHRRSSAFGEH